MPASQNYAAQSRTTGADRRVALVALALLPVVAFVVTSTTGYAAPLFSNPPGLLGLPVGVVVLFLAAALTALAVLSAVRGRPPATGWAPTVAFAVPALVIVLLAPAVIERLVLPG